MQIDITLGNAVPNLIDYFLIGYLKSSAIYFLQFGDFIF